MVSVLANRPIGVHHIGSKRKVRNMIEVSELVRPPVDSPLGLDCKGCPNLLKLQRYGRASREPEFAIRVGQDEGLVSVVQSWPVERLMGHYQLTQEANLVNCERGLCPPGFGVNRDGNRTYQEFVTYR